MSRTRPVLDNDDDDNAGVTHGPFFFFPPLPYHRLVTLAMAFVRAVHTPTSAALPDLSLSRLDLPQFTHRRQA